MTKSITNIVSLLVLSLGFIFAQVQIAQSQPAVTPTKIQASIAFSNSGTTIRTKSIREGESIQLSLRSVNNLVGDIMVNVTETGGSFLSDSQKGIRRLTIDADSSRVLFFVHTSRDDGDSDGGTITISVVETDEVERDEVQGVDRGIVTVTLTNYDAPVYSITSAGDVEEDDSNAIFTITSVQPGATNTPPPSFALTLKYMVSQVGDFLTNPPNSPTDNLTMELTFSTNSPFTTSLELPITDDNIDEANGTITVTLVADSTYALGMAMSETLNVSDNDTPELSIAPGEQVNESEQVMFPVTSDIEIQGTKTIYFRPAEVQTGDFLKADIEGELTPQELTFSSVSPYTTMLMVRLDNDEIDEPDGSIMVTLVIDSTETSDYTLTTGRESATAPIIDNDDPPMLSFPASVIVSEGVQSGVVAITYELSQYSLHVISFSYETSDGSARFSNDDYTQVQNTTEEIPIRSKRGMIEISILNNDDEDGDKEFSVTFSNVQNATISGQGSTSVTIIDDDDLRLKPTISISAVDSPIMAGQFAEFNIQTIPFRNTDLNLVVNLSVTSEGNFQSWRFPRSVKITGDTTLVRINTIDDGIDEKSGSIMATINQNRDLYNLGEKRSDTITIVDDPEITNPTDTRNSIATAAVQAILQVQSTNSPSVQNMEFNQDLIRPKVSVYGLTTTIDEGDIAQFQIVAETISSQNIVIHIHVTNSGNVLVHSSPKQVILSQNQQSVLVEVNTLNDYVADKDGTLAITILKRPEYIVSSNNVATVIVSDLDDRLRAEQVANLNQRVTSQLLSSVSDHSVSTIANRLHYANNLGANPTFKFGDSHSLSSFITTNGELLNNNSNSWYSLLDDTSFSIPLNPEGRGDRVTTIWGHGDYLSQTISSSQFAHSATGEGYVGNLGLDAQLGNYSFTGIAVSGSRIESAYEFNEIGSINYDSQLTILSPYVKFTNSTQDAYLSTIFGIGSGTTAINETEGTSTTQLNRIVSATLIGNQPIYSFTNAQQQSSGDLSLYGQTGWQVYNLNYVNNQNSISEVNRNLQVGATATYEQKLIDAGELKTTFSYGVIGDHRDGETILGQELTNDINVTHQSGFSASIVSEVAFTPITQGHRTAISGAIAFDRHQDEVRFMVELTPKWVKTEGQVFYSQSNDNFLIAGDRGWTDPSNSKLTTELSYGLPVFDATGIVTPYTAYELVVGEETLFDVGVSMQTFNNLQMTFNYRQTPTYSKRHDFQLRSNLKW